MNILIICLGTSLHPSPAGQAPVLANFLKQSSLCEILMTMPFVTLNALIFVKCMKLHRFHEIIILLKNSGGVGHG